MQRQDVLLKPGDLCIGNTAQLLHHRGKLLLEGAIVQHFKNLRIQCDGASKRLLIIDLLQASVDLSKDRCDARLECILLDWAHLVEYVHLLVDHLGELLLVSEHAGVVKHDPDEVLVHLLQHLEARS